MLENTKLGHCCRTLRSIGIVMPCQNSPPFIITQLVCVFILFSVDRFYYGQMLLLCFSPVSPCLIVLALLKSLQINRERVDCVLRRVLGVIRHVLRIITALEIILIFSRFNDFVQSAAIINLKGTYYVRTFQSSPFCSVNGGLVWSFYLWALVNVAFMFMCCLSPGRSLVYRAKKKNHFETCTACFRFHFFLHILSQTLRRNNIVRVTVSAWSGSHLNTCVALLNLALFNCRTAIETLEIHLYVGFLCKFMSQICRDESSRVIVDDITSKM